MWCAERLTVFEDDRNTALHALVVAREAQNLPVCGWPRQPLAADEHTDSLLATMHAATASLQRAGACLDCRGSRGPAVTGGTLAETC